MRTTPTLAPSKRRRWLATGGAMLLACSLGACSSSVRLRHVRALPIDERAPVRRLLVLGISRQSGLRRALEDAHVQALTQAGVQALASHGLPLAQQALDADGIQRMAREVQADAVALVKYLGSERTATLANPLFAPVDPSGMRRFADAWRNVWVQVHEPADATASLLYLQASVYRIADGELLWTAVAEASQPGALDAATHAVARTAVDAMLRARVV